MTTTVRKLRDDIGTSTGLVDNTHREGQGLRGRQAGAPARAPAPACAPAPAPACAPAPAPACAPAPALGPLRPGVAHTPDRCEPAPPHGTPFPILRDRPRRRRPRAPQSLAPRRPP